MAARRQLSEKGIALLMVLWVLMLLSVIVGEFCFVMRTRINTTRNFKESTQSYYIALAGLNEAILQALMLQMTPPNTAVTVEAPGLGRDEDEGPPAWRFNVEMPPVPFGDGAYTVRMENESGRVNLNLAERDLLRLMLEGLDLDEEAKDVIVDSILDWRDSDRNHLLNGAEDDYYQSLPEPYECRDGDFETIGELVRVRGVSPEIFAVLSPCVTVFPGGDVKKHQQAAQMQSEGAPPSPGFDYNQLNINAISPALWRLLGVTKESISDITAFREERDFQSMQELSDIIGAEAFGRMAAHLTLQRSPYISIESRGRLPESPITDGVWVRIRFDAEAKNKYRVLAWKDL